jgi:hypothetical protein
VSTDSLAQLHISEVDIRCYTPFVEEFVEELKRTFKFPDRRWDAEDKVWVIALRHERTIIALCRKYFSDVQIHRPKRAPSRPASTAVQTPYDVLYIKPTAPVEVVAAAYRALARKYHPDLSGRPDAHERMLELNTAYERLGVPK